MGMVWRGAAPALTDEGTECHSAPGAGTGAGTSGVLGAGTSRVLGTWVLLRSQRCVPANQPGPLAHWSMPTSRSSMSTRTTPLCRGTGSAPGHWGDAAAGGLGDGDTDPGDTLVVLDIPSWSWVWGIQGWGTDSRGGQGAARCGDVQIHTDTGVHTRTNTQMHTHVHTPALTPPPMCTHAGRHARTPGLLAHAAGRRAAPHPILHPTPCTLRPTPCCTQLVPHAWGRCLLHPSPPRGIPQPPAPHQAPCTPSPPAPLT